MNVSIPFSSAKRESCSVHFEADPSNKHNRLHREIEGISQKMLTKTLRRLERDGLAGRKVYPVVPPRAEYSLTPLGQSLIGILALLCRWAEDRIEEVEAARRDYDAREG
jgi:DNA-binding HxlR family transcriptional regulator